GATLCRLVVALQHESPAALRDCLRHHHGTEKVTVAVQFYALRRRGREVVVRYDARVLNLQIPVKALFTRMVEFGNEAASQFRSSEAVGVFSHISTLPTCAQARPSPWALVTASRGVLQITAMAER